MPVVQIFVSIYQKLYKYKPFRFDRFCYTKFRKKAEYAGMPELYHTSVMSYDFCTL